MIEYGKTLFTRFLEDAMLHSNDPVETLIGFGVGLELFSRFPIEGQAMVDFLRTDMPRDSREATDVIVNLLVGKAGSAKPN